MKSDLRVVLATTVAFCWGAVPAQCLNDAALVEKARKEGALHVVTNSLGYGTLLVEAFSKRYPFIKIDRTIAPPVGWDGHPYFEGADPSKRVDVQLRCQEPGLAGQVDRGWLAPLTGLPSWEGRPRRLEDDPRYVYFLGVPHVIVYDSSRISEAEAPRTYEELTAPRWRDRVVLRDPTKGNSGAFLVEFMQATRGNLDWYGRLAKNGARLAESGPDVLKHVEQGLVGVARDVELLGAQQEGRFKSVKMRLPEGELPYQFQLALMSAKAPHPAAASLFMNWVISDEAKDLLEKRGYSVGRRQVEHMKHERTWTMDNRALLPAHASRLDEAVRRLAAD